MSRRRLDETNEEPAAQRPRFEEPPNNELAGILSADEYQAALEAERSFLQRLDQIQCLYIFYSQIYSFSR